MAKSKVTLLNMITGLILQVCTVISGFVVPKIILTYFGSNTNGLIASLGQFLNYIALIEGGITSVVTANLYKPIVNNDFAKVSSVLVTAKKFYKKIAAIFVGYSLVVSIAFPLLKKTQFSFSYVFVLSMIIAVGIFIQYMFSLTLKTLLDADKKSYIVSITQSVIIVLNILLVIVCVRIYPSIHLLKAISAVLFVIQPILYGRYVNKNYCIDWSAQPNNELMKNRWNGFAINTAAFIHNCTDIAVLTIFTDLSIVSIYSVYALVANGLKQLLNSLFTGINPVIGQAYAKNDHKVLNLKLDIYEYIVFLLVFFAFTLCSMLITPFVLLYTKNVNDSNYNQITFGILLSISEAIYLIKAPHLGLAYTANQFKKLSVPAYLEAGINIVTSILLVQYIGLVGVAIGTIAGMTYRMIFHVYYTTKLVKGRKQIIFYRKMLYFMVATFGAVLLCNHIPIDSTSIGGWIVAAIVYSVILILIYSIMSIIVFRKELRYIFDYIGKR